MSKNFMVVGASSGIGFELCRLLSGDGHQVFALSRQPRQLGDLPNVHFHSVDVSQDAPQFPALAVPLHGIAYCVGSINLKPLKMLKVNDFQQDFNLNVLGAVRIFQQFLPNLQMTDKAAMVLFSTVAVQRGMAFHASVASAKGAIEGLTKSLAAELAPRVRVNCIAPSLTNTPLAEKLLNNEQKLKASEERHPLKRIGTAQEMAQAAKFLLDDSQSGWISGQIWHIDGGMSAM